MIDPHGFRDLMAGIPSPVTVLTTWDDGPAGATIGAFISLSMDPPLVLASLISSNSMLERVRRAGRFGVNVLGAHQSELAKRFAARGVDRFAGVPWVDENGLPRLTGSASWIECDLHSEMEGGDHTLVIGRILASERGSSHAMTYSNRSFGSHSAVPVAIWDAA